MSEVLTAPPARKCLIGQLLGPPVLALLERVPRNPQVRALVLKLAGKLPPPECETFEQVKAWIETHCEPRKAAAAARSAASHVAEGISLPVSFSDTEYGRADYSVRRHGSEEFHLAADDLMTMVQTAIADGDGLDAVVEAVAQKIQNDAWELCDPSMDDYGDYDYSEHDVSDTGDSETNCSRNSIRTAVLAFLRERHPELAAEL